MIASQLRQLPYHERVMAKMEIGNVVYSHLLRKKDMPQVYSQTNVRETTPPPALSFALTEMQSGDNHVFPQGYFFQQL